jgi:hypothetical protein
MAKAKVKFKEWWKVPDEVQTCDDAWSPSLTVISVEVKGRIEQRVRDN